MRSFICCAIFSNALFTCSKTLVLCAEAQQDSAQVLAEHEMRVETQCLERLQKFSASDIPEINRTKKQLSRAKSDLNAAKTKYESLQKSIQNSAMALPTDKLDSLRNDVDDAKHRLQQAKVCLCLLFLEL